MEPNLFTVKRKSYVEMGEVYFWTATINKWQHLMLESDYKSVITDSLIHLTNLGKVDVFAFVIMPNHIHLIWKINQMNGKEAPQSSFLKYTAHTFKKMLKADENKRLDFYKVEGENKSYEFWKRDSLAIHLFNEEIAYQKLDYLHYNPCTAYWQLAKNPSDYLFSSAKYYEEGVKNFGFLKDLRDEF
ncbi:putative transposase [Pedobacter sp. UYEF25]